MSLVNIRYVYKSEMKCFTDPFFGVSINFILQEREELKTPSFELRQLVFKTEKRNHPVV